MNKRIIKIFSKMLAFAILSTNTAQFAALNNEAGTAVIEKASPTSAEASPDTEKNKRVSIIKDVKSAAVDVKDLVKKHLSAQLVLYTAVGVASFKIGTKIGTAIKKRGQPKSPSYFQLQDFKTAVDTLSADEIKKQLNEEIGKYINRASDVFEIEDSLIEESHPKSLLLTLKELNRLFGKYKGFTDALINYKKKHGGKFTLLPLSIKYYSYGTLHADALAEFNLSGIAFGNLRNYESTIKNYYQGHQLNCFTACDDDKLIESMVAHEFGHIIEILYITLQQKINWSVYKLSARSYTVNLFKGRLANDKYFKATELVQKQARDIAYNIVNSAKQKGKVCFNNMTSRHGNSDPYSLEFFAETFAHSECSTYVNPLGQTLQEYIKDWFPLDQKDSTTSVAKK